VGWCPFGVDKRLGKKKFTILSTLIVAFIIILSGCRTGIITGTTIGLVIATVYLYYQIPVSIAIISKVVLGLAIAVNASGYLLLVLLIKPGLISRLKTRPVRVGGSAVITAALTCSIIHAIRFLPSPEAFYVQSKAMAILFLAALIAVCPLILKYIWCVWRGKKTEN
jgi:hypothetical protein